MRNPNRIPEILKELKKVWESNPDYRLGQIITVASRPNSHHPRTFYIEDDELLLALKSFGKVQINNSKVKPYWERYPEICRLDVDKLDKEIIKDYIKVLREEEYDDTITPVKLMELNGAPITDKNWIKGHQNRIVKLRKILSKLSDKGLINKIEIGYQINKGASA